MSRSYDILIVNKGNSRSVILRPSSTFGSFMSNIKEEFALTPNEMNGLELRQVSSEPSDDTAEALFNALDARKVNKLSVLTEVGVQFLVGKINEPAQPGAYSH